MTVLQGGVPKAITDLAETRDYNKLPARLHLGVNSNPHTYLTFREPNSPRLRLRDNAHRSTELGGDGAEVGNAVQRTEGLIKDVS